MMRRTGWLVVGLVILLSVMSSTAAFAQQGGGDQVVLGQNYVLRSNEELSGSLTVVGGTATLEENSVVHGDVLVMGGTLDVSGTIGGNLNVWGGSVALNSTAVIQGDLATFGGSVRRAAGAVIAGQMVQGIGVPSMSPHLPNAVPMLRGGPFGGVGQFLRWELETIGWALFLVLLGVIALLVAPQHIARISTTLAAEPALSFGLGLLTMIVASLVGALLLIALCLGVLVWLAALLALLVGWIAAGFWLGQRLLRALRLHDTSSLVGVGLGVFLITIVARLPWGIGFLVWLVVASAGLGAVVLTRFGTQPYSRAGRRPATPGPVRGALSAGTSVPSTASAELAGTIEPSESVAGDFVPDPPGLHQGPEEPPPVTE